MSDRICRRCLKPFPATTDNFYTKTSNGKRYLSSYCKECFKFMQSLSYDKHRAKRLDQKSAKYHAIHGWHKPKTIEEKRRYHHEYYLAHEGKNHKR